MPVSSATFYDVFVTDMVAGTHTASLSPGVDTDVWKAALISETDAPNAAADTDLVVSALTQATGGDYVAGGTDVANAATTSSPGVITVDGTDVSWVNTPADFTSFRYVVLHNSSVATGKLILWWDYGGTVTLGSAETFTVTFAAAGILTITA